MTGKRTEDISTAKDAREAVNRIARIINKLPYDANKWKYYRNLDAMVKEFGNIEVSSRRKNHTFDLDEYRPKLLEAIQNMENLILFEFLRL